MSQYEGAIAILQFIPHIAIRREEIMSSGKNQYVVRHGDQWAVRGEGNERRTRIFDTQREAIEFGRSIAQRQESELRIQGRDARFRDAYSYGNDPFPPEG